MSVEPTSNDDRTDIGLVFSTNGGTLPSLLDEDGRKLVLVSHEEYAELVAARSKLLALALAQAGGSNITPERLAFTGHARADKDPDVAAFLNEGFGRLTIDTARAVCR